jgi:putative Holliday junction resolvase
MEGRKILGVDFGERRLGLAIAEGGLAEPLAIVEVDSREAAVAKIAEVCQREKIQKIVVGLPSGSEKIKKFGQKLAAATGLKVIFWDETLTSEEALSKMIESGRPQKKRRHLDDVAAALILQEYLDLKP